MMLVPTPYSIINDPDDGEDVFETIIPDSADYHTEKRAALWARYHDTGIGNPDKAYWERCMICRANELAGEYDLKMRAYLEFKARIAANTGDIDLSDGRIESESVNRVYDPPEVQTVGDVAENYLSDQNRTDFKQKTYGGLETETVRQWMDGITDPFREWAAEFDRLFYWGL